MPFNCLYSNVPSGLTLAQPAYLRAPGGGPLSNLTPGQWNSVPSYNGSYLVNMGAVVLPADPDGKCPTFDNLAFAGYLSVSYPSLLQDTPGTMSAIPIQSLLFVIALFFAAIIGFKTGFRP